MSTTPPRLGAPITESLVVYRAFATKSYRERRKNRVRASAYHLTIDHIDGLSLGRTPIDAVSELQVNYGYCSINIQDIIQLPYGLEVRPDLDNPNHLLICNVPPMNGTDIERENATLIAGALARISSLQTCDSFPPQTDFDLPNDLD